MHEDGRLRWHGGGRALEGEWPMVDPPSARVSGHWFGSKATSWPWASDAALMGSEPNRLLTKLPPLPGLPPQICLQAALQVTNYAGNPEVFAEDSRN